MRHSFIFCMFCLYRSPLFGVQPGFGVLFIPPSEGQRNVQKIYFTCNVATLFFVDVELSRGFLWTLSSD